jgi:uncharacterized membrane protein
MLVPLPRVMLTVISGTLAYVWNFVTLNALLEKGNRVV